MKTLRKRERVIKDNAILALSGGIAVKKVLSFLALSGYFVAETSRKALIEQLQEE
jgi:hypothetical protein